jgi:DNA-binding beta-propeller fold protein YncE
MCSSPFFSLKKVVTLVFLMAFLCAQPAVAGSAPKRAIGDSNLIAQVPFPGYPFAIAVHDGLIYVETPSDFGVPGNFVPSEIDVYNLASGAQVSAIQIQGQPAGLHALAGMAFGDEDNLYVIDVQQGVLQINIKTGVQKVYATPFYPVYQSAYDPPAPLLPIQMAFDPLGNLYVTDTYQATIWRVPRGGGAPQVWYSSALIDGAFGPNGIRIDPYNLMMYFDVTLSGATAEGIVYRLPLVDHPTDADLKVFHTYAADSGPAGMAFGLSGNLYVSLAVISQISVLDRNGNEIHRFSGPSKNPSNPSEPLVWANPANIAFDDSQGRIVVTNQADYVQVPDPNDYWAVFDVYVNDTTGWLFGDKPGVFCRDECINLL